MNNDSNILQIELWRECSQKCKFCYLEESNCKETNDFKKSSLLKTISMIDNDKTWKIYNGFALIGGEFFQGQLSTFELESMFENLIQKIKNLLLNNTIKNFWLTATLTNPISNFFKKILKELNRFDNIWICTSYDTIGRFHSEEQKKIWEDNVLFIKHNYTNIHLNTTFIITQDLIDTYKKDNMFFKNFKNIYNTQISFKCPDIGYLDETIEDFTKRTKLKNFFPRRSDFIFFLTSLKTKEYDIANSIFNKNYRANTLYENFTNNDYTIYNERNIDKFSEEDEYSSCGHSKCFCRYSDSNKCMMCDRDNIFKEMINE